MILKTFLCKVGYVIYSILLYNYFVTVPPPSLSISLSRTSDFFIGTDLTMSCNITVDPNVDTSVSVNVTWTMTDSNGVDYHLNSNSLDGRITVDTVPTAIPTYNSYQSQVRFSALNNFTDSGTYYCNVSIIPVAGYTYLMRSDARIVSTNFTVTSTYEPKINNNDIFYYSDLDVNITVSVSPDSFLGLETSCPDSDPYDNFTLVCTAIIQASIIPDLAWYHNGAVRNGVTQNNGLYVTNTLKILTSSASDSGTYRCQASLNISDSNVISLMEESNITIRRKYK